MSLTKQQLLTDLQTNGINRSELDALPLTRKGGAGPSDHQAVIVDDQVIMVPVFTHEAKKSPFTTVPEQGVDGDSSNSNTLFDKGIPIADITFAGEPKFYSKKTKEGIPYSHIATLHSTDVLATTVLQNCIRYDQAETSCQFCSIGQSLGAGKTIAHKTPEQLAEVAEAAVELDQVKHMVMTTGTPPTRDRGAKVLCDSVLAVKNKVDLPIQVQCEPPKDLYWIQRLKDAGADSLGLHLEVVNPEVRKRIMPSKASITVEEYLKAFKYAVEVFGRGQVSTYILAGLGDSQEEILEISEQLIEIGVYPFVVPFVPISGTRLENHPSPSRAFMEGILEPLGEKLVLAGMTSETVKSGCAKCGACSSLKSFEEKSKQYQTLNNQTPANSVELVSKVG